MRKPVVNTLYEPPPTLPGEDETLWNRHIQVLSLEYTKTKRGRGNIQVTSALMDKTYSIRRGDILRGTLDLRAILVKYPYLQCSDQVCSEFYT